MRKTELFKRVAVAVVALPIIITAAHLGKLYFLFFVSFISIGSVIEFYRNFMKNQSLGSTAAGVLTTLAICLDLYFYKGLDIGVILFVFFVYESLYELFFGKGRQLTNLATKIMGVLYCNLFGIYILIREIPIIKKIPYAAGGKFVMLVFIGLWLCDTAAYLVGSSVKTKHALHKKISPNKSWEGAIAGFLMSLLSVVIVCTLWIPDLVLLDAISLGFLIGFFGQLSDLVESMFKRDAGIKDSSHIIPGHGGILDRFDSSLLVTPIIYIFLYVAYIPRV